MSITTPVQTEQKLADIIADIRENNDIYKKERKKYDTNIIRFVQFSSISRMVNV